MFWADEVAQKLKKRNLALEWVDDMKTPSGRIHVGALRGVVIHDLVYKALKDAGVKAKYTYVFENHDPMDALPIYLPKEKFEQYLGMPLFKVPSPEPGFNDYAEYFAKDFMDVFNAIGCNPEILWTKDLYTSGKMNAGIKLCLDKADVIRNIYEELYKKPISSEWYPFQAYCEGCGKVSTVKVYKWDGEKVFYRCVIDAVKWTKGCGYEGSVSPFADKNGMHGKLSWKVEWPVKWQAIGVTVEGAGKDHMSKGGSHDLSSLVCERVLNYPVPYPIEYEFFLVGGKKMSSSKGLGSSARDMYELFQYTPELLRFLMVRTKINQAINFDPTKDLIWLMDEYFKASDAYYHRSDKNLARIFELSQIEGKIRPLKVQMSTLAQWVQMPNMEQRIKDEKLEDWAKTARIWVEKYAPESEKFLVQKSLPDSARNLLEKQREYLQRLVQELEKDWNPEDFQKNLYEWTKELGIPSKEAFAAIYLSLIGKDHGPKAGWLILSLDKEFVKKRFSEIHSNDTYYHSDIMTINVQRLQRPEIFTIDQQLKEKFPSVSVGVAIIKGVNIKKSDPKLEKEKEELLRSLESLTTEQLGQYPEVISYRKLYKEMGLDWHSRRPSPEALLRRIVLKKGLYTINTCVDAYNLVVMKHRISVGAFDEDKIEYPTVLRLAKDGEEILLLGDSEPTKYTSKEIAYFDKKGGINIDFNFRDAQRTAVQLETKNLYVNVDGVYDVTPQKVQEVLQETCDTIIKYCGGIVELFGIEIAS